MTTTPIDFVLSERMSETSRAALTIPAVFTRVVDRRERTQGESLEAADRRHVERRQYATEPQHSAFDHLTASVGAFPDAADFGSGRECVL